MQALPDNRRGKWRKLVFSTLIGGAVGFAVAFAVVSSIEAGVVGELEASRLAALLVALVYFLMGAAVGFGAASPRLGSTFLNVEDADEIRDDRAMLILSAIGCVLLGLGLAVLALSGDDGVIAPGPGLAVFGVAMAASTWLSVKSFRMSDELMREVMGDGAAASFYLSFAVLGGWAALAHFGFVAAPAMIDIVTLFFALTLVGCFWIIGRRGMLVR